MGIATECISLLMISAEVDLPERNALDVEKVFKGDIISGEVFPS